MDPINEVAFYFVLSLFNNENVDQETQETDDKVQKVAQQKIEPSPPEEKERPLYKRVWRFVFKPVEDGIRYVKHHPVETITVVAVIVVAIIASQDDEHPDNRPPGIIDDYGPPPPRYNPSPQSGYFDDGPPSIIDDDPPPPPRYGGRTPPPSSYPYPQSPPQEPKEEIQHVITPPNQPAPESRQNTLDKGDRLMEKMQQMKRENEAKKNQNNQTILIDSDPVKSQPIKTDSFKNPENISLNKTPNIALDESFKKEHSSNEQSEAFVASILEESSTFFNNTIDFVEFDIKPLPASLAESSEEKPKLHTPQFEPHAFQPSINPGVEPNNFNPSPNTVIGSNIFNPPIDTGKSFETTNLVTKLPKAEVIFVNGIGNTKEDAEKSKNWSKNVADVDFIELIYNRQRGVDIIDEALFAQGAKVKEAFQHGTFGLTDTSKKIILKALEFNNRLSNENDRLISEVHSRGALDMKIALKFLNEFYPEVAQKIIVVAIAPADFIPSKMCAEVYHLVSLGDPVPALASETYYHCKKEGTVIELPQKGGRLETHSLMGGPYEDELREIFAQLHKNYKIQ